MRDTFIKILTELAEENPKIFLIAGDLGFGVLTDFAKTYPDQFLNVGVAEQNMTGIATGLALEGRIVFTYSIANFPTLRCLEQIRNDACYHEANVKIVAIGGGFAYGALGMSHHATEDLAIMRSMPITVCSPGDLWETEQATSLLANTPGTCYLRLDKSHAGYTNKPDEHFILGRARRLIEGNDVTLIATGGILKVVLQSAESLLEMGIKCRVVSVHTINPLDNKEILAAAVETGGILTIEEHTIKGGLGGAVAEICLEQGVIPKFFYRLGLREGFASIVGSQNYLRQCYGLDKTSIVEMVKSLIKR